MSGDPLPPMGAEVDELFRRIGRNLLNYQSLERALKAILAVAGWSGPARKLDLVIRRHQGKVASSTLGQLVGRFGDQLLPDTSQAASEVPAVVAEPHVSFRVELTVPLEDRGWLLAQLEAVLHARNDLVHHLGQRWDHSRPDSIQELLAELDRNREELRPLLERVNAIAVAMQAAVGEHARVLASDELWQAIEQAHEHRDRE